MSNAVYPVLKGLSYDVTKTPLWNTIVKKSASGVEVRAALAAYPRYSWLLNYEYLKQDVANSKTDVSQLIGFYNARQGSFDSFLFTDPDDNAVTGQQIGTGDGATLAFQLQRTYGGFSEPIYDRNVGVATVIKVNGVTKTIITDYSIDANGVVTFVVAPAAAAVITADFGYYFRVRFLDDNLDVIQFMNMLYTSQLTLISARVR